MEYVVTWDIDITADSPREAAEKALRIQRDPQSTAVIFVVENKSQTSVIDLRDINLREE